MILNNSVICHRLRSRDQFTMLFLRIPDTLSELDLLAAVCLVSRYFTYSTYVRIRRNCLDGKIIIPYMRANRTTRDTKRKNYSDQTTITLNDLRAQRLRSFAFAICRAPLVRGAFSPRVIDSSLAYIPLARNIGLSCGLLPSIGKLISIGFRVLRSIGLIDKRS